MVSSVTKTVQNAALAACVALTLVATTLAFLAARTKSPTYDEPVYPVAGWLIRYDGDFRINPEHPALWKRWATIFNGRDALHIDPRARPWNEASRQNVEWAGAVQALFQTPGVDGISVVARSRLAMVLLFPLLGLAVAFWSWRGAGPIAAVLATFLLAFDPNVLAHAGLVTNDVPVTTLIFTTACLVWLLGERVSMTRVLVAGLACGIAVSTKFSALLLAPIIIAMFVVRVAIGRDWIVGRRHLAGRWSMALVSAVILVVIAAISWGVIWAAYDFRFAPSPDGALLDTDVAIHQLANERAQAAIDAGSFSMPDVGRARRDPFISAALYAQEHKLLPQAYTAGLIDVRAYTAYHSAFLLGDVSGVGWSYYFPLVLLFKAPLGTLAAIVLGIGFLLLRRRRANGGSALDSWFVACLIVPLLAYGAAAVTANANLGVRHILPMFPFVFVLIGASGAMALRESRRSAVVVLSILAAALAVESLAAYPDYISFFNTASGGERGGIHLLGDSNLDWGQDLPALARWRRDHPDGTFYLAYFGTTDPAAYGLRYVNLPGGYVPGPEPAWPRAPGYIAVSASILQGIYVVPRLRPTYRELMQQTPLAVLGGSIYIYRFDGDGDDFPRDTGAMSGTFGMLRGRKQPNRARRIESRVTSHVTGSSSG